MSLICYGGGVKIGGHGTLEFWFMLTWISVFYVIFTDLLFSHFLFTKASSVEALKTYIAIQRLLLLTFVTQPFFYFAPDSFEEFQNEDNSGKDCSHGQDDEGWYDVFVGDGPESCCVITAVNSNIQIKLEKES